ncbi:hypothetical protein [Saccharopolyspora spinosa]|uniref:hypothetical protein n=1 Tax=Saccharopolyspora spinosa TaxID=60894 RepID=UPI000237A764|nr:hypothetical protein [Saccharopolyspora spinosa]
MRFGTRNHSQALSCGGERYQEVAQLVVNAGTDVNIRDRNGSLARREHGYTEIAEVVRSAS